MKLHNAALFKRVWVLALAFVLLFPASMLAASAQTEDAVRSLLSTYHVSGVTEEQLAGKSIPDMLQMLDDPFTAYMTHEEYKSFLDAVESNYVGIGIRIGQDDTGLYIADVFKDMPAYKAGIKRGDYITAVDGVQINGLTATDLVSRITGKEGTKVTLTIARDGKSLSIPIVRALMQAPVIESRTFDQNGESVGYIKLSSFSSNAGELFTSALDQIRSDNPDLHALVIDLRYNGGGYVEAAKQIAQQFMKEGIFLHLKDRTGVDHPLSIQGGKTFDKPVYILMNEYSASASEILAGALRDTVNAKLIGTQSYGKGSVQYLMPLPDDEALKVTVEEYFTPKFGRVNKVGLKPDRTVYLDTAQLIAVLHEAGMNTIDVDVDRKGHVTTVNGVDVEDSFDVLYEDGQPYVPSRLLAEMIGADISWDADTWSVQVTTPGKTNTFKVASGIAVMRGNMTYMNLQAFSGAFPSLNWTVSGDELTLQAALPAVGK